MKKFSYIFIFICFLPILILRDFTPNNELKYLSIANEAISNGHVFTFWNHGVPYADKPPLYLWIIMLGKWLFHGHYMFFLSLFSILPAIAILRIIDKWVKPYLNSQQRTSGQLMLITSGLFAGSAIVLRMDMLMCMFILLALYTFYKIYTGTALKRDHFLLPVYVFLALFTKGPVGLLVPLLTISTFLIIKKQIRHFSTYLGWRQWSILFGLCLLWFGSVWLEGGNAYLNNLLFNQTVNRAIDAFHHKEPFWYYFKTIWYSLAPWSLLYIICILLGIKQRLLNTDLKKFFFTAITTTFIALSIFSGKLDIYLLPIFPFIAYLCFLLFPELKERQFSFTVAIPAFVLLFALPLLLLLPAHINFPILLNKYMILSAAVLSLSSAFCLYLLYKKQFFHAINSLSIGILLTIFIGGLSMPAINPYIGFGNLTEKAKTIAGEQRISRYYYYNFRSGENLDVYLNQKITPLSIEEIKTLRDQQTFILFVREKDLKKNTDLQNLTQSDQIYPIGNYNIILLQNN